MNVDEAMEAAKAYLVAREQMQEPLFESEEVAVTLAREVERLQVWKTRWKDAAQKLRRQLEESGDGDTWLRACRRVELELEKTHTEVERLRAEVAQCKSVLDGTRTELSICQSFHSVAKKEWQLEVEKVNRLEAQLAAAKAASVCPVGITDLELSESGHRIEFYLEGDKPDGEKMLVWLRDRMKDATPPEA